MKYVKMDNIEIPQIALGTWAWGTGINGGGMIFGNNLNENELKNIFDQAIACGFTLWDTAAVYGMGTAETILGHFIKDKKVIISTKFTPFAIQSKNAMKKSLDKSLSRLGINEVDIYWIHNSKNVEKWTNEIILLIKSGKVKRVGVSNHNLDEIKQAASILEKSGLKLSAVQNHYSLLYRASEESGIIDWCKENNVIFFAYMILEQGVLTGKYTFEKPLKKETRRGQAFPPETLKKLEGLIASLENIGNKYNASISQIVTAWAIAKNTVPIIGVTKISHISDANSALNICLSVDDINLIEKAAKLTNVNKKVPWENVY